MKIKKLKNYGIPSYIVNIWEKNPSPYLLPLQEEAVRNYGILNYQGSTGLPSPLSRGQAYYAPRNDKNNLLVIAPPSSGKSFLGEMAAIAQAIHRKKIIYLVPLRALADEKYRHFKDLYSNCGLEIAISTRDRREDDCRIIRGNYQIAVMAYEKFNYFLLQYPQFLDDISLLIIDEMQMINNPKWGPLLRDILEQLLQRDLRNLKIIALSAFVENQKALLKWFPARLLISYKHPVELRKGMVREGIFKYITSKKKNIFQREIFFKPESVRDNCFEDYLLETVKYLISQNEAILIFFPTCADTRKWSKWLAARLEAPPAASAVKELGEMEETLSHDELLILLGKGIAYHNQDLSWEERNLVETYLKKGEIKIVCATNTLAMGINLPFKNVIIALDKMHNDNEDYLSNYRTSLSFADIENMGGRAGISGFGRLIFLAYSLISETVYQNDYFYFYKNGNNHDGSLPCWYDIYQTAETIAPYCESFCPSISLIKINNYDLIGNRLYLDKENGLLTFLLKIIVYYHFKTKELKKFLKEKEFYSLQNQNRAIDEKIDNYLNALKENWLIKDNKKGILSPTPDGILIIAKRIKVETYLFLKTWMKYSNKGEINTLEILLLLSLSKDGKKLPLPFPQFYNNDDCKKYGNCSYQEGNYGNKLIRLVYAQGDENKKLFRDMLMLKKVKEDNEEAAITSENHLAFEKTLLLYDWIKGSREIKTKTIEQKYELYRGAIYRMGEGFSWLADSLAALAESEGWKKGREEDLNTIISLSKRLIEGVKEEGLNLIRLYVPGLNRYYIGKLLEDGYKDENCLKELSEEQLIKVLPKRLVNRIQKRFALVLSSSSTKNNKTKTGNLKIESGEPKLKNGNSKSESGDPKSETGCSSPTSVTSVNSRLAACSSKLTACSTDPHTLNTNQQQPTTILEIDTHRPDRIIFMGKEFKVTTIGFSLLYLLAQHREKVISYEEILKDLWKGEKDAIYTRINYHICKIRKDISKIMDKKEDNTKKIENIFKTIPAEV